MGEGAGGPSLSHTNPAEPSRAAPSRTAPPATPTVAAGAAFTARGGRGRGAAAGLLRGVEGRSGPATTSALVCAEAKGGTSPPATPSDPQLRAQPHSYSARAPSSRPRPRLLSQPGR